MNEAMQCESAAQAQCAARIAQHVPAVAELKKQPVAVERKDLRNQPGGILWLKWFEVALLRRQAVSRHPPILVRENDSVPVQIPTPPPEPKMATEYTPAESDAW